MRFLILALLMFSGMAVATETIKYEYTYKGQPVSPPSVPSNLSGYSQDLCVVTRSGGVNTGGIAISGGTTVVDQNCERMKLSKLLYDYGMKVAAVTMLCQDERVFEAMEQAGTPCPFEGKIGKDAKQAWEQYDFERPDYDKYIERMTNREKKVSYDSVSGADK